MKVLLWLIGFTLCLVPTLFTLATYPFSLYKHYGGITETEFNFTQTHSLGFLISSFLASIYLYFTRNTFFTFLRLIQAIQPQSLAKPLTLLFIIGLTGVMHTLIYSNFVVNLVVGFTIFLGFLGIYSIYESLRYKEKQKRWIVLIFGFMSVLIAYFTLEVLLADMYRST